MEFQEGIESSMVPSISTISNRIQFSYVHNMAHHYHFWVVYRKTCSLFKIPQQLTKPFKNWYLFDVSFNYQKAANQWSIE